MNTWYIYLTCYEGSGYFTGIILTTTGREVGVHPYKNKAYRFDNRNSAFNTAKSLKQQFSCIISYEVRNA